MLVASVLVHACAIAWVQLRTGRIDTYAFNSLDCGEYYSIARNILRSGTFSQSEAAPFAPDTWRTPGYPMLLAAGMFIVGDSPTGLIIFQQVAAILSVLIFFHVASRHMSAGRAVTASAIFLIEPYHLIYSFWLLSTTFFTLALLAAWWAWERTRVSPSVRNLVLLGFLSGLLVLIWPGAMLIPLFVIAALALHFRSKGNATRHETGTPRSRKWLALGLIIISCLAPPLAWMTRNRLVAGHFALSHQSGIVLAYFKATEVELWRQGRTEDRYTEVSLNPVQRQAPHIIWEGIDEALCMRLTGQKLFVPRFQARDEKGVQTTFSQMPACSDIRWFNLAQGNKTHWDSFRISRELGAIGRDMLLSAPGSAIACNMMRIAENLTFPLDLAIKPAEGAPVNRIKAAGLGVANLLLVLAAGVGVFRAWRKWPDMYFPIACVIALSLTTAPQIDPRFRVPLIPFLAFLALLPVRRAES